MLTCHIHPGFHWLYFGWWFCFQKGFHYVFQSGLKHIISCSSDIQVRSGRVASPARCPSLVLKRKVHKQNESKWSSTPESSGMKMGMKEKFWTHLSSSKHDLQGLASLMRAKNRLLRPKTSTPTLPSLMLHSAEAACSSGTNVSALTFFSVSFIPLIL